MATLPPYASCSTLPSYSLDPALGEARLEQTPLRAPPRHQTGNYLKRSGRDVLVLTNQDSCAPVPTYGRRGGIMGFVALENRETVDEVVLKINGSMVMISEGGSLETKLIDDSYTLWSSARAHTASCPSAVPFSVVLPSRFQDDQHISHPLPPTYSLTIPQFFFRVSYSISVVIVRRQFQILNRIKTISTKFNYCPRSSPPMPIQSTSDFFSDLKTMPEEWRQVISPVAPRSRASVQPLNLHLFLPSAGTFGLTDSIPIHIQLTGPATSLQMFLPASSGDADVPVSATLTRQVFVNLNGRSKSTQRFVIGHAKLTAHPPQPNEFEASLDWGGVLTCSNPETLVGMFDVGCVRIQDFVAVDLRPRDVLKYGNMRVLHPIRLVTDSWFVPS
ncbi:hypothetical protein FB45DRAFT_800059 [Roridomyces roridus]|uniref:Uncharacterized protein n=1 Tax=Roridomyces roridus TaxID=1738132 RepID=A0AAD7FHV1_9AGAR|nr:hypothetical protein FB45DRAFT_800059 [Roridomyces roridus]